ncbi:MAG TPA: DUF2779 domain-containing protein [Chitinophagales bacterium]|nr:DUF2779 domain-containing protein [Chitinophagales bacterium]
MSSKSHQLSKSTLIRSIQCLKSLYLYKNHYNLRDIPDRKQQQKFDRGHRVGKLAQQLFPGGKDCTPPSPMHYQQSIAATKLLIENNYPIIYEAAFKFQGILVALDILECKDGNFYAYEVKSSMSVSQTYIQDCAIQYYVIQHFGIHLTDFQIVHINNNYVKNGALEVDRLFKRKSVLKEIVELQPYIQEKIDAAIQVLSKTQMPEIAIGAHCSKPYPCDFMSYCWKDIPANSIWFLQGVSLNDKLEAVNTGILTIDEYAQKHQDDIKLHSYLTNKEIIQKENIANYFKNVQYPICFFDVEAFQSAIPIFDGTKPYERIPFLYSLHIQDEVNATLIHKDYFSATDGDYRKTFIKQFLEDTKTCKTILVYNDLIEKGVLYYLANLFPEFKPEIDKRIAIMLDVEIPFKRLDYYHPKQLGSLSLKTISATMLDINPYNAVDVKDGQEAMAIYNELFYKSKEDQELYYDKLRSYCKTDTYVLSEVYKKLLKIANLGF